MRKKGDKILAGRLSEEENRGNSGRHSAVRIIFPHSYLAIARYTGSKRKHFELKIKRERRRRRRRRRRRADDLKIQYSEMQQKVRLFSFPVQIFDISTDIKRSETRSKDVYVVGVRRT